MVATAGSILGNYAPQMEEPYGIETALAKGASQGSQALEGTMLDSYWLERQMREGDYARRLANQMAYGQQYLAQQGNDAAMRAITEGAKTPGVLNMLASSPQYGGMFAGMDPGAIANAADMAQRVAQSGIYKNTGQGTQGFATAGVNVPTADLQAVIPGATQGTPIAVQAQQVNAAGRLAAAQAGAAGRGMPKETDVYIPGATDPQRSITYPLRGGAGYNLPIPPAGGGGGPPPPPVRPAGPASATVTPNQPTQPPANFSRVTDPAIHQNAQIAISQAPDSPQKRDIVNGYVGNKPNVFTDGKGGYVVQGKSGTPYALHPQQGQNK